MLSKLFYIILIFTIVILIAGFYFLFYKSKEPKHLDKAYSLFFLSICGFIFNTILYINSK